MGSFISEEATPYKLLFKKSGYNWLTFCKEMPPCIDVDGSSIVQNEFGEIFFRDENSLNIAYVLLNGKLQYLYWSMVGDDFHLATWMFKSFPINFSVISPEVKDALLNVATTLDSQIQDTLDLTRFHGRYELLH